jgi:hypothetical protein
MKILFVILTIYNGHIFNAALKFDTMEQCLAASYAMKHSADDSFFPDAIANSNFRCIPVTENDINKRIN